MIRFNNLSISNFGSIRSLELKLSSTGIHVITGHNGAGKTTIFSALYWAIYGKPLKGSVEPWQHIRPEKGYTGTKVILSFKVNGSSYTITRTKNGKKGNVELSGLELKYKKDIQESINTLFGYSPDLFKHSILFGQKLQRFSEEDGTTQKDILERIFSLGFIEVAKKSAQETLAGYHDKLSSLEKSLGLITAEVNGANIRKDALFKVNDTIDNALSEKYTLLETQRLSLKEILLSIEDGAIDKINDSIQKLNLDNDTDKKLSLKYQSEVTALTSAIGIDEFKVATAKGKIRLEEDTLNNYRKQSIKLNIKPGSKAPCPTCKTMVKAIDPYISKIIDTEETLKGLREGLRELEESILVANKPRELKTVNKNLLEIQTKLNDYFTNYNALTAKLRVAKEALSNKVRAESLISESIKNIKTWEDSKAKNLTDIGLLNDRIAQLQGSGEEIEDSMDVLYKDIEVYGWIIQKPLSNSGLKAYIFQRMLALVNSRLFYYARYTNKLVTLGINSESARKEIVFKVVDLDGNSVPFNDLSGGQKQLINITISLAINEVVNSINPISLILFDEVYESLDESNIEIVTSIISQKAREKGVYLISHIKTFSYNNSSEIQLSLENNITTYKTD